MMSKVKSMNEDKIKELEDKIEKIEKMVECLNNTTLSRDIKLAHLWIKFSRSMADLKAVEQAAELIEHWDCSE